LKLNLPQELTTDEKDFDINEVRAEMPNYLQDIVGGSRYTGLITSQGELWLAGNTQPPKNKKDEEEEKMNQALNVEELAKIIENDDTGRKCKGKLNKNKKNRHLNEKGKDTGDSEKEVKQHFGSKASQREKKELAAEKRTDNLEEHVKMRDFEKSLQTHFINMTPLVSQ